MIYLLNIEGIPRLKTKKIEINGLGAGEYGFSSSCMCVGIV